MKVALIVIYNHQFNSNIPIIENIYKDRFANIYHIVPFYKGDKSNVIPVYDNSFYFQGYIAQGYRNYFEEKYDHYFFIADDMVLNPVINEGNYNEHFNLDVNSCFLPGFINLHEQDGSWPRIREAFNFNIDLQGVEVKSFLPNYDTAMRIFKTFNLEIKPLNIDQLFKKPSNINDWIASYINEKHLLKKFIKNKLKKQWLNLNYPLVGSYSDICIVNAEAIDRFSHYCGVFAATKLFVEVALPTALVLSASRIVTEENLALQGKSLWVKEDFKVLDKYQNDLDKLLSDFPKRHLYLHPIKLSKWKTVSYEKTHSYNIHL